MALYSFPISRVAIAAACIPALLLFPGTSPAADQQQDNSDGWIVTVGGAVEVGPSYPGSKQYTFGVIPSFDIRRFGEDEDNAPPDDNLDYTLFSTHGFEIGPVVGFRDSRSSKSTNLNGVNGVKFDIDAGAFVQYWIKPDVWRVRAEVRQGLSSGSGLVVDVGSDWFQPLSEKWLLSAGPRATFGDDAYMKTYFGVSPTEASRNGRISAFDAEAGIKTVGFTVSATYTISPDMSVQIYDRYERLVGDAARSPIVSQLGTANQNIIGIAFNKSFDVKF
ncbi:MipA/OmpV family protein [Allorhizobium taibaishanense]|uniref:MipA/OmpV family protein n=1 Tax=Allorhizobium taibaishanense TaxID=887144 RepID=UPI0011153B3C